MYVCPNCQHQLKLNDAEYKCSNCSSLYPRYKINEVELVDFLGLSFKNNCQCQIDGKTICKIDLKSEFSELVIEPNKREKTGKQAKLIKDWCGKGNKILDAGCREAPYGDLISEENEVYGLDNCIKAMLLKQREGINDTACNKGYRSLALGNCLSLPFPNEEVDFVLATEIIEHIFETRQFIREIYRVLKKGGKVIISTPNLVSIYKRFSVLFGSGRSFIPWAFITKENFFGPSNSLCYPEQKIHVRFFTFSSLRKFLEDERFFCLEMLGTDPLLSKIPLFDKIFKTWADGIIILAIKT